MNLSTLPAESASSWPETSEDRYEIVDGNRVELTPLSAYESYIASLLVASTNEHASGKNLGRVVSETLFRLDDTRNLQRRPDVAFVSYDRWPRGRRVPRTNAWAVIPDLEIEIISATNTAEEVVNKVHEYFAAGVREVWLVWSASEEVYVYQSPTSIRVWTRAEELHDSAVLPELRLPLAVVFEEGTSADAQ